jgi:hypothetical protein
MTYNSHTHLVIRYTDFGQIAELRVPKKYSTNDALNLAATLGGTLHRITITDEPITMSAVQLVRDHDHNPVSHDDGKPPWCDNCGLTAAGTEPERWAP